MAYTVQDRDIELTTPQLVTVDVTEATLSASRLGLSMRSFFSIVPITAGVTVTVTFGDAPATANQGLPLIQSQPFSQSLTNDDPEQPCKGVYQGTIKAIASGPGRVAFVEIFAR